MLSIGPGETGPKTSRDFNSIQSLLSSVFRCATARNDLLVKKRGGSGSIEPASKTDVTPEYNSLIPLPLCCQMFEITENYLKEQYDITGTQSDYLRFDLLLLDFFILNVLWSFNFESNSKEVTSSKI